MIKKSYIPKGYWDKERCQIESLNYKTRNEFHIKNYNAYISSCRNRWLDEVCSHMVELRKPNEYWNKKRCKEDALNYTSIVEYKKKSGGSYNSSKDNGWLDEVCSHMVYIKPLRLKGGTFLKSVNVWTKELCDEESSDCLTPSDFRIKNRTAYNVSVKKGWLNDFYPEFSEKKVLVFNNFG